MSGILPVPLTINQTKAKLLEHLSLSLAAYDLMAKETVIVYKWLTSTRAHLKINCVKDKPPYDWSDLREKSKDEAMVKLATSGSVETGYYWNLAGPTTDCDNWIARWFLYHLFRLRDRRYRSGSKRAGGESHTHGLGRSSTSSKRDTSSAYAEPSHEREQNVQQEFDAGHCGISTNESMLSRDSWKTHYYIDSQHSSYTLRKDYKDPSSAINGDAEAAQSLPTTKQYWDPVRDI